MTFIRLLMTSAALALSAGVASAATLGLEVSFDLAKDAGSADTQMLNSANILFKAEFADGTVFTSDRLAAPRAVAASHSFTISGSGIDGTYFASAGTVGLFSNLGNFDGFFNSTESSFINGDGFPIAIAGIASQLRFDAGNTIPDHALGDSLTLADLQAAVFGSGGLTRLFQSGSGSTSYNLTNFKTSAYEVGALTPVPLPAALPLMLVGMGAFGVVRRGRSRRVQA